MNNALLSGLSGLRINQQFLDVIGNNLANANTVGYKTRSLNFRDVLAQTISPGSGPTGARGGVNPFQVGRGVSVGSVDNNFVQGSILSTGRALDLAIQGQGFFVVSDGSNSLYTRAGAFTQDADDFIVDSNTGFRVQSLSGQDIRIPRGMISPPESSSTVSFRGNLPANVTGPLAEILQTSESFEEHTAALISGIAGTPNFTFAPGSDTLSVKIDRGNTINVTLPTSPYTPQQLADHLTASIPGATATVSGGGIVLTSDRSGENSVVHVLPSAAANLIFAPTDIGIDVVGTETPATLATDLNSLQYNTTDYVDGSTILITGSRPDGTSVSTTFTYGSATNPAYDGTTLQEMLDHMSTIFDVQPGGAFYTFDAATGNVSWTAYDPGEASFTITIRDDPNNTLDGATSWNNHSYDATVQGTDPDEAPVTTIVHDATGQPHVLTFTFERQIDGSWNLLPSLDATEGTVTSPAITGITFASDGSLLAVPSPQLTVQWTGVAGSQDLNLDFGTAGDSNGLTQYGATTASVSGTSDGHPAGVLESFDVRSDGLIQGFFTNGQISDLDTLAVAMFANPEGLKAVGSNMWQQSGNSGSATITTAQAGAAGSIVSFAQEGSNVDIAEEFVKLIEAQRSFQASARIITTTDEILAELVNLV